MTPALLVWPEAQADIREAREWYEESRAELGREFHGATMRPNPAPANSLTKETILHRLRESYPQLTAQFGVRRIGLFGSFAKENAQESSDVDLIVEFQRPIGLKFVEMVEYLEALLGRRVDVLTLAGLGGLRLPEVARQIEESVVPV